MVGGGGSRHVDVLAAREAQQDPGPYYDDGDVSIFADPAQHGRRAAAARVTGSEAASPGWLWNRHTDVPRAREAQQDPGPYHDDGDVGIFADPAGYRRRMVEDEAPPGGRIMAQDGTVGPPVPAESVPSRVLGCAAWLSALANGSPIPPDSSPPHVFAAALP